MMHHSSGNGVFNAGAQESLKPLNILGGRIDCYSTDKLGLQHLDAQ
jgi:hypothetical protein